MPGLRLEVVLIIPELQLVLPEIVLVIRVTAQVTPVITVFYLVLPVILARSILSPDYVEIQTGSQVPFQNSPKITKIEAALGLICIKLLVKKFEN